jgi:hypothetical protein
VKNEIFYYRLSISLPSRRYSGSEKPDSFRGQRYLQRPLRPLAEPGHAGRSDSGCESDYALLRQELRVIPGETGETFAQRFRLRN